MFGTVSAAGRPSEFQLHRRDFGTARDGAAASEKHGSWIPSCTPPSSSPLCLAVDGRGNTGLLRWVQHGLDIQTLYLPRTAVFLVRSSLYGAGACQPIAHLCQHHGGFFPFPVGHAKSRLTQLLALVQLVSVKRKSNRPKEIDKTANWGVWGLLSTSACQRGYVARSADTPRYKRIAYAEPRGICRPLHSDPVCL